MELKVTSLDIDTGNYQVAMLNLKDAVSLGLHAQDRIRIVSGKSETVALIDLISSEKLLKKGYIALSKNIKTKLGVKSLSKVDINLSPRPPSIKLIKKKLDGKRLTQKEMDIIIKDVVDNNLSLTELTYFIAADYMWGLTLNESVYLTKSIINTGQTLGLKNKIVVDKHCIGGIPGNRTTLVVVPILLAAGLTVPKTSSRSITSPAGTADTMEVLCNVSLSMDKLKKVIKKTKGCMAWGGGLSLAPADDKIINVESPLKIDSEGNLLASIMAKKGSVGATHLLIDIPVGKHAKVKERKKALRLKDKFEKISRRLGIKPKVVITKGDQPIGYGIGPALEAIDVMRVLQNDSKQPLDLRKKSIEMAGHLLELTNKSKKGQGAKDAKRLLDSGKALSKMRAVMKAQGAKVTNSEQITAGKFKHKILSPRSGTVREINNKEIAHVAFNAGAPLSKGAGILLNRKKGDKVKKGETLYTIFSEDKKRLDFAKKNAKEIPGVYIR